MRWTGEQAPPPLPPPRKRIGFPAEILLIESREGCGPLEHTRRRRGRIPLRTTLSQIPLKSFGFPGAESARKRFFLRGGKPPLRRNQRPGATNRNLRFRLVGREATCLPFGQATFPPRRSPTSIGSREGSHPLALSRGLFWWRFWFPTKQASSFVDVVSDDTGRGARCSPTPPRATRCERAATLSRSPGAVLLRDWFPTMQAVLLRIFVSVDAGVGRAAPLQPLG